MIQENEKNSYQMILLFVASIVVVVGYAWLASRALEPKVRLPSDVISEAAYLDGSEIKNWSNAIKTNPLLFTRLNSEIGELHRFFEVIGRLQVPIELIIVGNDPLRYRVTDERVELGLAVVEKEGQLAKALLKAWILQSMHEDIGNSLLRTEVVSDVLLALWRGHLELESPVRNEKLVFPMRESWPSFLKSFAQMCDSAWRPLEIVKACTKNSADTEERSSAPTSLAVRPLLGSLVWQVFQDLSFLDRMEVAREWTGTLRRSEEKNFSGSDRVSTGATPDSTLSLWRVWVRAELDRILPTSLSNGSREDWNQKIADLKWKQIRSSQLDLVSAIELDYALHLPQASDDKIDFLAELIVVVGEVPRLPFGSRTWVPTGLVSSRDTVHVSPGWAQLEPLQQRREQTDSVSARTLIWESCEAPTLHEVLNYPVIASKILFVQSCEDNVKYGDLFISDIEGFARANPEIPFIQMKREALLLALRKGILQRSTKLSDLMRKFEQPENSRATNQAHKWISHLGLGQAQWKRDVQAYRVLGAIEAIEWFRSAERGTVGESNRTRSL